MEEWDADATEDTLELEKSAEILMNVLLEGTIAMTTLIALILMVLTNADVNKDGPVMDTDAEKHDPEI